MSRIDQQDTCEAGKDRAEEHGASIPSTLGKIGRRLKNR